MKDLITIYSKKNCIYCDKAKDLLNEKKIDFHEVVVDVNDHCVVSELQDRTQMKTFPQIFIGKSVLGGYSELKELDQKTGLTQFL